MKTRHARQRLLALEVVEEIQLSYRSLRDP
jgi:hypothetical protein